MTAPGENVSPGNQSVKATAGKTDSLLASEVIQGRLFVGNFENAVDPVYLESSQFTHVLNVSGWGSLACQRHWDKVFGSSQSPPIWMTVKVRDLPRANIAAVFSDCFEFLDGALAKGNGSTKVLLHCQAGVSRSATVAIAYLMHRHKWTLDVAYSHVLAARSIIKPNKGFMAQLLEFHKSLFNGSEQGSEECQQRLRLNDLVGERL
jgi:hypothetical protein